MIDLALLNQVQIKDAIAQRAALIALQQSYDASKVITTIEKPGAVGGNSEYYTAEELLESLRNSVDNIDEYFTDAEIASIFSNT